MIASVGRHKGDVDKKGTEGISKLVFPEVNSASDRLAQNSDGPSSLITSSI